MERNRPRSRRTLQSFGSLGALLWVVILGLLGPGCRENVGLPIDRNAPPETVLTGAPGDSQTAFYTVKLYWSGFDTDGSVMGFEWAITESLPDPERIEYHFTTRTDSTFRFSVPQNREILAHRFYVRAIDDDGRRDPTPAFTFFSSRNTCAPEVIFTRAEGLSPTGERRPITSTNVLNPTDTIPAGWAASFAWRGEDCDAAILEDGRIDTVGRIERYFYKLSPRQLTELGGALTDTAAVYEAAVLSSQTYTFFVRPVDDAGFSGLDPAVRSFVWNLDPVAHFSRALLAGATDSVSVCFVDTTGNVQTPLDQFVAMASGDTLPIPTNGVRLWAKVLGDDPDDPQGSNAIFNREARVIQDVGLWESTGEGGVFFADALFTGRGSWKLMCRVSDRFARFDGTPDSIVFYINRSARFLKTWTVSNVEYTQSPLPGEVFSISPGQTLIPVRFAGHDPDGVRGNTDLEFRYKFDRYPLPDNQGTRQETFFSDWIKGAGGIFGTNAITPYLIKLQTGQAFVPGEYTLRVDAEEFRSSSSEFLGKRVVSRIVRFSIVEG